MEIYKNLSLEDMEDEVWKDIEGYEGLYQVSNKGRVKSLERMCETSKDKSKAQRNVKSKIMVQTLSKKNYPRVGLSKEGKYMVIVVHRLVAKAFVENPMNKKTVDHINTVRTDNRVENLRWLTQEEQFTKNAISKERMDNVRRENQKKVTEFHKKKVRCVTTGEEFNSIKEASMKYNITDTNISRCCKGKYKHCGKLSDGTKLVWEYIN